MLIETLAVVTLVYQISDRGRDVLVSGIAYLLCTLRGHILFSEIYLTRLAAVPAEVCSL